MTRKINLNCSKKRGLGEAGKPTFAAKSRRLVLSQRSQDDAMLGPQKLPKNDQEPKKKLPRPFFDSQEAKNDELGPLPRRGSWQVPQKASIFEDLGPLLDHFFKTGCITITCLRGTQKTQQKHESTSSLAFGATCKKARKLHKKPSFFKKKGLEKGHPKKDFKNIDFRPFLGSKTAENRPFWS